MRTLPRAALVVALGLSASATAAAADRVAVLRFVGREATPPVEVEAARRASRAAIDMLHDVLPSDAELAAGEASVTDGAPDTTREYRAAGLAAHTDWTVAGHVESHGWTYRLELEVCQVASGRVESLVREIDARQAAPQIAEMLALLLRQEGLGNTVPPWLAATGPVLRESLPSPANAPDAARPSVPAIASPPTSERTFGVGLGAEVLGELDRGGGGASGAVTLHLAAELPSVPGFALVAGAGAAPIGATSLAFEAGGRFAVPAGGVFLGPELAVGALYPLGGRDTRVLVCGTFVVVVPVSDGVDVEAYPETAYAAGGTGPLWLVGGGVRVVRRF